jgi:hypothetical protein
MPRSYALELETFQSILIGTTVNLGLLTSPPGGTNPGTEVSGPGYARAAMTLSQAGVLCAINKYPVVFSPTGSWPTAQYFGVYDMTGVLQYWGVLAAPVSTNGGTVTIAAGTIFIDWIGQSNVYHPQWGNLVSALPLTAGNITAKQIGAVTSLPSSQILITVGSTTYSLWPVDQLRVIYSNAVPNNPIGSILRWPMNDNTMGSPAGFNVSIPAGMAY